MNEKSAEQIVIDEYFVPSGAGAPKKFYISRNPSFKGSERELAEEAIRVLKKEFAKSPREKHCDNLDTIESYVRKAFKHSAVDFHKEYTVQELRQKLSVVWGNLDFALLHLSNPRDF